MIDYEITDDFEVIATKLTYELFDASALAQMGVSESIDEAEEIIFRESETLQKAGCAGRVYLVRCKKETAEVNLYGYSVDNNEALEYGLKTIPDRAWREVSDTLTKAMAFVPTPYEYSKEGETVFVPTVIFGTYLYHLDDEGALTAGRPNRVTLAHYWANPTKKITLRWYCS